MDCIGTGKQRDVRNSLFHKLRELVREDEDIFHLDCSLLEHC